MTQKRSEFASLLANPAIGIGLVMVLAVAIRLKGVSWGLPYQYDPDEHYFVDPAVRFVTTGDLNPHWFGHPGSTTMYALGLAFFVYWMIGHVAGWFPDLESFAAAFSTNPTTFYLIGRTLNIALATLSVPLTYVVARRMVGPGAALAAALFVAVSPLHAEFSRIVRTDTLMTTFLLAAMLYAIKAMEDKRGRNYLLIGVFTGLATATKFPGIVGGAFVILAIALSTHDPAVTWKERRHWLGLAFLGGLLGFFAGAPFIVTGAREVYWALYAESSTAHLGGTGGVRGLPNYLWYLNGPLREAMGLPLEVLALIGLVVAFTLRQRPQVLLATFSILFLLGIGLSVKRWDRWAVPLVPCVAMLAAIALDAIARAIPNLKMRPAAQNIVVVALGIVLVAPSATLAFQRGTTEDTRDIAKSWIEQHVPRGSKIAMEQYTPPISRNHYQVFIEMKGALHKDAAASGFKGVLGEVSMPDALRERAIEYVVITGWFERYRDQKESYPALVRSYEGLFASSDLLYELRPTESVRGPAIQVLKLR